MALLGVRRSRAASAAADDGAHRGTVAGTDADQPDSEAGSPGGRPPNVSREAWESVPDDLRDEILRHAADGLRRCIHPDETVRRILGERGIPIRATADSPRGGALKLGGARRPGRSASATPPRADVPAVTSLGLAIHASLGLPGIPGREAAKAQEIVLSAIRANPVLALSDPGGLSYLCAGLTRQALESVSDLVQAEAERVIEDIRARKEAGDPSVADWLDPDGWMYGEAEMGGDCIPAM